MKSQVDAQLGAMERARLDIVRTYRTAFTISHALAYEMESVGDEAMRGHEERVLAEYAERLRVARDHRHAGSRSTRDSFSPRTAAVLKKNEDLLARVARGSLSRHGAALLIDRDWERRGQGERPAFITLRRWINKAVQRKG